ncbi:NAD(P)-binding protein [Xylariomycetidae sp. FL0641]|nr:NAD(P)-binding protein [Xylariomycetidae sp. FL0641]
MTTTTTPPQTVAFLGASTGIGLAALQRTLASGAACVALCRTPSKLTAVLPPSAHPNLTVLEGNAHDAAAVARLLRSPTRPGGLVDAVVTTIGPTPQGVSLGGIRLDDAHTCRRGMATLLAAIATLRAEAEAEEEEGGPSAGSSPPPPPRITAVSSTGLSRFGRDVPLPVYPVYAWLLKGPHEDKRGMEEALVAAAAEGPQAVPFTLVRPAWLTGDGKGKAATGKPVRVGVEDPKAGVEAKSIGYSISREDAGRWIAEQLVLAKEPRYLNKVVSISY